MSEDNPQCRECSGPSPFGDLCATCQATAMLLSKGVFQHPAYAREIASDVLAFAGPGPKDAPND